MSVTLADILDCWPHKKSGNGYRGRCPAHGGDNPTALEITETAGKLHYHCYAHDCTIQEILTALGLWEEPTPPRRTTRHLKRLTTTSTRRARRRSLSGTLSDGMPAERLHPVRFQADASTLLAACYCAAILADHMPSQPLDERLGCYLAICEDLGRVYLDQGHPAARALWDSWQPQLTDQAPAFVAMMRKGVR
jgi:hypothetical protein